MANTSSNEVFFPQENDYNNWKTDVSDYTKTKKEFQGKPEPTKFVSEKDYKTAETKYNPIT